MAVLFRWVPPWLKQWAAAYIVPLLKVEAPRLLRAMLRGGLDALLLILLPVAITTSSQAVWNSRYTLTTAQQQQVARWAAVSAAVARLEDVPPAVPLVLWYKEAGLQEVNPGNCEGIMGLYTAVTTGQLPCFTPGTITAEEVARQLRLGAAAFRQHCPEVHYNTTDPEVLKRCYLYYNAGRHTRLDPDRSGYVMNGYDAAHQDMLHVSARGETVRLQALGAWPAHLAIQTQIAQSSPTGAPPLFLSTVLTFRELTDRLRAAWEAREEENGADLTALPRCRQPIVGDCFVAPHSGGDAALRPTVSPLAGPAERASELACDRLPGLDLEAPSIALLRAPMPGEVNRYADQWGQLALRIENEEWILWLVGLRSTIISSGRVEAGQTVGAISGVGSATPSVHLAVFDKISGGYVDPVAFFPEGHCPASYEAIQHNRENTEGIMLNLTALLPFAAALLAIAWVVWLVFKKDLLAKGPVQVIMYFIGVLIVLIAVALIVDYILFGWIAQRLESAQSSADIQRIEQLSQEILDEARGTAAPPAPTQPTALPTQPGVTPVSPQPTPQPTTAPSINTGGTAGPGEQIYVVQSGDNLYRISLRFGVSQAAIQQRNGIADPNRIRVGQQLIIPAP